MSKGVSYEVIKGRLQSTVFATYSFTPCVARYDGPVTRTYNRTLSPLSESEKCYVPKTRFYSSTIASRITGGCALRHISAAGYAITF